MSTRGYLTIIDGKKNVLSAAFYPSSAYPSYLGLEVLDAFKNNEFIQLIDRINQEHPEETDMLKNLRRDWYVKGKDNKNDYFYDYAYELHGEKGELTVFHFGDKALTIPYDQIPLFRFLFEHEDQLYVPLCLDEKTMTLKKDFYQEIRRMLKASTGEKEFQEKINQNSDLLYMELGRCVDPWNRGSGSFNKNVRTAKGDTLKFCVHESFGKFYLYVQTPFVRAYASPQSYSSAKAAERAIAEIIRTRPADISATISFFQELKGYQEKIKTIFSDDTKPLDFRAEEASKEQVRILSYLNNLRETHQLLGSGDHLYEREIKGSVWQLYSLARMRHDQAEKNDLSASLANADLRKQGSTATKQSTPQSSMER